MRGRKLIRIAIPERLILWKRSIGIGALAFWLTASATLVGEFLVETRRGPLFAPALRRHGDLAGFADVAQFVTALAAAHFLVMFCLYRLVRRLHGTTKRAGLAAYDFMALGFLLAAAIYAAKLQIHRFFGGNMDLEIVRNLGGGSLIEALLYVRSEAVLLLLGLAPLVLIWFLLRRMLRGSAETGQTAPLRKVGPSLWAAAIGATAAILFWAGQNPVMRHQTARFSAPWLLYSAFGEASDLDRDGYSLFSSPVDGHPLDAARHPFALDVPGNGIDEDDFGGDFRYRPAEDAKPVFGTVRRHVVLVVLESTRAEAIGRRWQGRLVAPNLTALARTGSSAPEAYSHHALSAPSLKTIFTGRIAAGPTGPSLFRDFRAAGYRVAVLSSQAEDFGGIAATVGMRENSDIYLDAESDAAAAPGSFGAHGRSALDPRRLLREMDRRLGAGGWGRPTFVYVNLQPPHFPYSSPDTPQILPGRPIPRGDISAANRLWVARTYWNAVAYADRLLGQILERLRALGVYDDTVVVVVGDHGEELFENGYIGHGHGLNRLQGQVPLVFSTRVPLPDLVGHQDMRALILRAAGADVRAPTVRPVLQYVGDVDHPWQIGMIEPGGRWTIYTPATGEVWSAQTGPAGDYADLARGHPLRGKVEQLVDLWMSARWEQRLASGPARDGAR